MKKLRDELVEDFKNNHPTSSNALAFETGFSVAWDILMIDMDALIETLENINEEELSSMRPGGGYSESAVLSYKALTDWKLKYEEVE